VRPGPSQAALGVGLGARGGRGGIGRQHDLARAAVDERGVGQLVGQVAHADDAGDAELTGDDGRVARGAAQPDGDADHEGRVEAGGVGRCEVVGEQHRRLRGHADAGLGLAEQLGHHAVAHVAQVGDALGHEPAGGGEHGDELVDGARRRGGRAAARLGVLGDEGGEAAVLHEGGRGAQDLRGGPAGEGCALLQAAGDGGRRGGEELGRVVARGLVGGPGEGDRRHGNLWGCARHA
jgi:hypothetical protein